MQKQKTLRKTEAKNLLIKLMAVYPLLLKPDDDDFKAVGGYPAKYVGVCGLIGYGTAEEKHLQTVFKAVYGTDIDPFEQFGHSFYESFIDHRFRAKKVAEMIAYLETTYNL